MIRLFALTLILFFPDPFIAQTSSRASARKETAKKAAPKAATVAPKAPVDTYDPDKLEPSERACGRLHAKNNHPCECMKARVEAADKAREACMVILDDKERLECGLKANACHVQIIDADPTNRLNYGTGNFEGVQMPAQCSRSCHKARCECCKS